MSRYLDRILPADATQALAARRLIYPGLSMHLHMGPGGWRIRASGPMGTAETLLPKAGRAILPTLKTLAEQVCINRFDVADEEGGAA